MAGFFKNSLNPSFAKVSSTRKWNLLWQITIQERFRREGNKKTANPFSTYVYTCASILNGFAENKNDAHRAERGITMDNEKKELSINEMEQVGGGSENTSAEPEKNA